jgi:hypothetical protein
VALQVVDPDKITALELRWRLETRGYEVDKIDWLSRELKVDLLEILAGWAPVIAEVMRRPTKLPWWKRWWTRLVNGSG